MSLNFPNSPAPGQTFTSEGATFVWNGTVWIMQGLPIPWASDAEIAAGVVADKVLSPATATERVSGIPVPVDAMAGVPTDVLAQRLASIDHKNDLGRPMFLFIEGLSTGGMALFIGPTNPATMRVAQTSVQVIGHVAVLSAFIPTGWSYSCVLSSGTLNRWHEWR